MPVNAQRASRITDRENVENLVRQPPCEVEQNREGKQQAASHVQQRRRTAESRDRRSIDLYASNATDRSWHSAAEGRLYEIVDERQWNECGEAGARRVGIDSPLEGRHSDGRARFEWAGSG